MNLIELQQDFRSWLTSASDGAAQRLAGGTRAGLSVYQNNYRAQLVGCLQATYPQLRAWIGDETFLYAAVSHIDRCPPHAWTLDAYGEQFGDTLLALFPDNPDIHEFAWIESALSDAFVARDAAPLDAAVLPAVDWETARLGFTPSLRLAPLTTNAADIWWAMRDGQHRPEGEMLAEARGMIVWRRACVSCLRTLDALDFAALMHACTHGSFSALCDMLAERLGDSEGVAKAGALLAEWISSELITGLDDAASPPTRFDSGDPHHD
jgi:hypothetical protein